MEWPVVSWKDSGVGGLRCRLLLADRMVGTCMYEGPMWSGITSSESVELHLMQCPRRISPMVPSTVLLSLITWKDASSHRRFDGWQALPKSWTGERLVQFLQVIPRWDI